MYSSAIEILVYYVYPLLVLVIGFCGKIAGLIVIRGKKLHQIGPLLMYRVLFAFDLCFTLGILDLGFQLNISFLSNLSCKIYYYLVYSTKLLSPLMLIYISIDRYICIIYQNICSILKRKKYQIVYLFSFFFFNSLYYIPALFTFDLTKLPKHY